MNPRIEKIKLELDKNKEKLAKLQARQRELERQLVELQNADILAVVRAIDVSPEELPELIKRLKAQPIPKPLEEENLEN